MVKYQEERDRWPVSELSLHPLREACDVAEITYEDSDDCDALRAKLEAVPDKPKRVRPSRAKAK